MTSFPWNFAALTHCKHIYIEVGSRFLSFFFHFMARWGSGWNFGASIGVRSQLRNPFPEFGVPTDWRINHQPGNHYIGLIKNLRSLQKGELNMFEVFMMWSFFGWSLSRGMIKIWKNHTESGFLVCRDHLLSIHDFDDEIFQDNRPLQDCIIILMKIVLRGRETH